MSHPNVKYAPPAITLTAFNCPHCGALAKQTWFALLADALRKDVLPLRISAEDLATRMDDFASSENPDENADLRKLAEKISKGLPFLERRKATAYGYSDLLNVHASACFNCDQIAVWVNSAMVWPVISDAPRPNPDLPVDVRLDFEEAGRILSLSPRGAAALLRLAIQKLCAELGERGKNIDDDIASLVKKGLDVRIQRSLDIVRVIGNEAVHPGQIDLRDDVATAGSLFELVNVIADAMISQPKHIDEMYASLPEGKRAAIERRDGSSAA